MKRRLCALALAAALGLLGGRVAFAQEPAPAPAPAPAAPAAPPPTPTVVVPTGPSAIPIGEIAARVESARAQLGDLRDTSAVDPVVIEIEKELEARESIFRDRVRKATEDLQNDPSLEELEDIQSRASVAERMLEAWQKALSAHAQAIDRSRNTLDSLRETWKLTYEQARAANAPAELIDNVKQVRSAAHDLDKELDTRFDAILKLQSVVADETLVLSVLRQDVRRVRYEARGRLLEPSKRPLVAAIWAVENAEPVLARVREGLVRDARNVQAFAALEGGTRVVAHGVFFLVFFWMALRMRRWIAARGREGKTLGPSEAIFDHPISVALLLAVLVTPWIHPWAPRAYVSWLGVLLVAPIILLIPKVMAPELRSVWLALGAVFVVDRIRYVFQSVELVERLLLLILTVGAAAIAVYLLRRDRFAALTAPRWRGALAFLLRFAVAALALASVANLAGFVALASLLGLGILRSATVAVVLVAAVNVALLLVAALLRTPAARTVHWLQNRRRSIEERVGSLLGIGAALWWGFLTLDGFGVADSLEGAIAWLVTTPIPLGDVAFSLGDVLLFLATAGGGVLLARLVRTLLEEDVFPRTRLARGVPHAVSATVRYAILIAGFLLAAAAAGFEWNKITLLAGAFGVGIGFGLQNIINNFVSGLILLYERPIQVGDTVEVGTLIGEVKRIGIRSSSVRTWQGAEVIVPNGNLIAEQVVNWTLSDHNRRIDLPVGVAYTASPPEVIAILEEVARANPSVLIEPPPVGLLLGFGESSLDFELRAWCSEIDHFARVRSEIAVAIHAALNQAGIAIPFPQRDVRLVVGPKQGS